MNGSIFIHRVTGNAGCKNSHFITILEPCVAGIVGALSILCQDISIRVKCKFHAIQFHLFKNELLLLVVPAL